MKEIDFYFDFASPYAFLAARKLPELALRLGRKINWTPFLIGAVYKEHGGAPLSHPLKADYVFRDVFRRGKLDGVAMTKPANFPAHPVPPSRVTYWIDREAPEKTTDFVLAAFDAFWTQGTDTSDAQASINIAASLGFDAATVAQGTQDADIKDHLRYVTEGALKRGVFGSPFIIVDDEPFWGGDRFDDIARLYG